MKNIKLHTAAQSDTKKLKTMSQQNKQWNSKKYEMQVELLQPWSTFVMKTKLPPLILEKMIKITDEVVENRTDNFYQGAGQIEDQFEINFKILEPPLMKFLLGACRNYVVQAFCQSEPADKEKHLTTNWYTQIVSMWINSQKNNEYFPIHLHTNCSLSGIIYLKIPEYLPSRRISEFGDMGKDALNNNNDDGALTFIGNTGSSLDWGAPSITLQPQVGDLFIFPSSQYHFVYPFRTADGKAERRNVSFNAIFSNKSQENY
jgi:hypothetical protein